MTPQQTFDFVLTALRAQKIAARTWSGCRFHGDDGTKCAVGHLIPDELYVDTMECFSTGGTLTNVRQNFPHVAAYFDLQFPGQDELLTGLQEAHDNCMPAQLTENMTRFENAMSLLAEDYDLVYTEPV